MVLYSQNKQGVFLDECNRFIYEVRVIVHYNNIFSTQLIKHFSSEKELNIVPKVILSKYTYVVTELYSAPLKWLLNNNFKPYTKPIKIKKNEQKNKIVK